MINESVLSRLVLQPTPQIDNIEQNLIILTIEMRKDQSQSKHSIPLLFDLLQYCEEKKNTDSIPSDS